MELMQGGKTAKIYCFYLGCTGGMKIVNTVLSHTLSICLRTCTCLQACRGGTVCCCRLAAASHVELLMASLAAEGPDPCH